MLIKLLNSLTKVSTAGPMEKIIRLPTNGSWKMALIEMTVIFTAVLAASVGAAHDSSALFFGGIIGT